MYRKGGEPRMEEENVARFQYVHSVFCVCLPVPVVVRVEVAHKMFEPVQTVGCASRGRHGGERVMQSITARESGRDYFPVSEGAEVTSKEGLSLRERHGLLSTTTTRGRCKHCEIQKEARALQVFP